MLEKSIIRWAGTTVSGTRKALNEDSWIVFSSDLAGAKVLGDVGECSVINHDMVFAISDGMGGGNAGDLASSLIIERMALIIPQTFKAAAAGFYPDSITHLEEALKEIHKDINQAGLQAENTKGMAATLALAWFTPDNMYLANVGDTRIYLYRDGKTEQLTRDHTLAWASWKRGEISEFQFRQHPRRSALYEVVGAGHPSMCPYFSAIPYFKGDRFLICSDGLIDGVWERHIAEAFNGCKSPEETSEILLKRSIANSGVDDTTLVVIDVD